MSHDEREASCGFFVIACFFPPGPKIPCRIRDLLNPRKANESQEEGQTKNCRRAAGISSLDELVKAPAACSRGRVLSAGCKQPGLSLATTFACEGGRQTLPEADFYATFESKVTG
jgi:hypothetical protein